MMKTLLTVGTLLALLSSASAFAANQKAVPSAETTTTPTTTDKDRDSRRDHTGKIPLKNAKSGDDSRDIDLGEEAPPPEAPAKAGQSSPTTRVD